VPPMLIRFSKTRSIAIASTAARDSRAGIELDEGFTTND
jgi:hypothetical protein